MANFGGYIYTVKKELKSEIMNAVIGSSAMKKEINSVFSTANSRIRALKNSGMAKYSMSYNALGNLTDKEGAFFSTAGYSVRTPDQKRWKEILEDYSRAVSFLNSDDSTITGVQIQKSNVRKAVEAVTGGEMPDDAWNALMNDNYYELMAKFNNIDIAKYVQVLNDIVEEYTEEATERMKADSEAIQRYINDSINTSSKEIADQVTDMVFETIDDLL